MPRSWKWRKDPEAVAHRRRLKSQDNWVRSAMLSWLLFLENTDWDKWVNLGGIWCWDGNSVSVLISRFQWLHYSYRINTLKPSWRWWGRMPAAYSQMVQMYCFCNFSICLELFPNKKFKKLKVNQKVKGPMSCIHCAAVFKMKPCLKYDGSETRLPGFKF